MSDEGLGLSSLALGGALQGTCSLLLHHLDNENPSLDIVSCPFSLQIKQVLPKVNNSIE